MTKENELQYLRRRLAETTNQHRQIAQLSGVPQGTVSRIFCGADPRLSTAVKLLACLRDLEAPGSRALVYNLGRSTKPATAPATKERVDPS